MANNIDRGGGSAVAGWMPGTYAGNYARSLDEATAPDKPFPPYITSEYLRLAGKTPGTSTTYTDPTDRIGQLDPYSSNGYITDPDTINAAGNLPAWSNADAPMSAYVLNELLSARASKHKGYKE